MASAGALPTGSLDQGVSGFCCAFCDQVLPDPSADARNPNCELAITLIQGAGVHCPSSRMMTYSRACAAKPPSPLKNSDGGVVRLPKSCGFSTALRSSRRGTG